MKVKISVTLDIDAAAWTADNGTETPTETREDVQRYAAHAITEHLRAGGYLTTT